MNLLQFSLFLVIWRWRIRVVGNNHFRRIIILVRINGIGWHSFLLLFNKPYNNFFINLIILCMLIFSLLLIIILNLIARLWRLTIYAERSARISKLVGICVHHILHIICLKNFSRANVRRWHALRCKTFRWFVSSGYLFEIPWMWRLQLCWK
jgi:hypothetical protein